MFSILQKHNLSRSLIENCKRRLIKYIAIDDAAFSVPRQFYLYIVVRNMYIDYDIFFCFNRCSFFETARYRNILQQMVYFERSSNRSYYQYQLISFTFQHLLFNAICANESQCNGIAVYTKTVAIVI